MKLNQTELNILKPKTAVEHFKRCPSCGDHNLLKVAPEVLCLECDWNSIEWSVSCGSMDNIFLAAQEHGARQSNYTAKITSAPKTSQPNEEPENKKQMGEAS